MIILKRYLNILEIKRIYDIEWIFRVKGYL